MILNYKKDNMLSIGKYSIRPGVVDYPNLSASEFSELLKLYPKLKHLVSSGDLETNADFNSSDEGSSSQSQDPANALAGMRERDAIATIKQTTDMQLLQSWMNAGQSSGVSKAIQEQYKLLEKANSK